MGRVEFWPVDAAKIVAAGVRSQKPATPPDSLLALLDGNQDGELSGVEMDNAAAALRTLDKNGDGQVAESETPIIVRRRNFARFDRDDNGYVAESEIVQFAESLFVDPSVDQDAVR